LFFRKNITKSLRGHANLTIESLAKIAFALGKKWECVMVNAKDKENLYFHPLANKKIAIAEFNKSGIFINPVCIGSVRR